MSALLCTTHWNTNPSHSMVHRLGDWLESFRKICLALFWYSAKFLPDWRNKQSFNSRQRLYRKGTLTSSSTIDAESGSPSLARATSVNRAITLVKVHYLELLHVSLSFNINDTLPYNTSGAWGLG